MSYTLTPPSGRNFAFSRLRVLSISLSFFASTISALSTPNFSSIATMSEVFGFVISSLSIAVNAFSFTRSESAERTAPWRTFAGTR